MERDRKQLDYLAKLLGQFEPEDIQKLISKVDGKQKQELLNMAINMLQKNMSEQEKETLNSLLQALLKKNNKG